MHVFLLFLGMTIVELVFFRHVFKDELLDLKPKMSGEQIYHSTCKELKALVTTKSRTIKIHAHFWLGAHHANFKQMDHHFGIRIIQGLIN